MACVVAVVAAIAPAAPSGATTTETTFSYTGGAQTYKVPSGVSELSITAVGAAGGPGSDGGVGGKGGAATARISVVAGETLYIYDGQQPSGTAGGEVSGAPGTFGAGGSGGTGTPATLGTSGGGGGATTVYANGTATNDRIVVGGAGGGPAGFWTTKGAGNPGGNGGNPATAGANSGGGPGTQTAGGAVGYSTCTGGSAGTFGRGGNGDLAAGCWPGGGGGGGYYGGGGGGSDDDGGGGGSSWITPNALLSGFSNGTNSGAGYVTIAPISATNAATSSTPYVTAVQATHPYAFWQLNNAPGSPTMVDSSGNAHTGTYTSGVVLGQPGRVAGHPVAQFTGTTKSISKYATTTTIADAFTFEAWVDPSNTVGKIFGARTTSNVAFDVTIAPTYVHADIGSVSGQWLTTTATATYTFQATQWYAIGYVVDASGWTAYVDGQPVSSGAFTGTPVLWTGGQTAYVGWNGYSGNPRFTGSLSDVAIFTKALTATAIANQYATTPGTSVRATANISPGSLTFRYGLTAPYWKFTDTGRAYSFLPMVGVYMKFDIADARGSGTGWHVDLATTVFATDAPIHKLPNNAASVQAAPATYSCDNTDVGGCTLGTNTVSYPIAIPAGTTTPTPIPIFSAADTTGMGDQTIRIPFVLTIPAAIFAGIYHSTWTFSLVSGP